MAIACVLQRAAFERHGVATDDDIIYAVTSSASTCPSYDANLPDLCRDTAAGYSDAFILPVLQLSTSSDRYT